MPRIARIAFPSMLYHIISRGNHREPVFQDKEDFEKYLESCRRYKERFGFKLYHWVLMNNHVHFLECGRYIERNPLRANLVKDPKEYLWSSYRVYAYGEGDGITDEHGIYEAMGRDPSQRQRAYREYVCSNRDKEEQEIKNRMGYGVIGAEKFRQEVEKKLVDSTNPGKGRPRK